MSRSTVSAGSSKLRTILAAVAVTIALAGCKPPATPTSSTPTSSTPSAGTSGTDTTTVQPPATTDAGIPAQAPINLGSSAAQAHEQSALLALGDIKALLTAKEFEKAKVMATSAASDYADTLVAKEFAPLLQQAQTGAAAAAQDRAQVAAGSDDVKAQRYAQFVKTRDAGIAAMDKQDAATAAASFQAALQIEDDADVREMLQQAMNMNGKPRVAVAKFDVAGDVGIPDAGKAVSELMQGRFDPKRFQVVDRARLEAALAEQNLTLAQIGETPKLLRVKKFGSVRYIVTGSVVRVGHLSITARLVDVVTGDVVQTAEIGADDAAGLESGISDLVAMLQMTDDEKAAFIAFKQKQADALVGDDAAAKAAAQAQQQAALDAERQRIAQAQDFAQMQHERDAAAAVADIRALLAAGDCFGAQRNTRWALQNFADTQAAKELAQLDVTAAAQCQVALQQQRNAAEWRQIEAERMARHQRFLQFRDQGFAALATNDMLTALAALTSALGEEDNPAVREVLDQVNRRMRMPGIVVLDFEVRGELGVPRREAGRQLAAYLETEFARSDSTFRPVGRDLFVAQLATAGLRLEDVVRDPAQPRMRVLRNSVRYVVVAKAWTNPLTVSAALLDVSTGRTVQTAEFVAPDDRALGRALSDMAMILQMNDEQKADYLNQLAFAGWMAKADAACSVGHWEEGLEAYRQAYRIRNTADVLDRMTATARQVEAYRAVRREYEAAMASAANAARGGDWNQAMDFYRRALVIMETPEAKAGYDNARRKAIESAEARRRYYDRIMAEGDGYYRGGDLDKAVIAYTQAVEIDGTPEAKGALARANKDIADRREAVHRSYVNAMNEAKGAIQKGDWDKALDAFTRAAAIENTREAASGIATARQKITEAQTNARLYDAAMKDAQAAATAGDWKRALEAYTRAAGILNTADAKAGAALAKAKIAELQLRDQKKLYDAAFAKAEAHAGAGRWQEALEDYRAAYDVQKTKEAMAGITKASKMLSDAAYTKKQYDSAMSDAAAAIRAGNWDKALAAYQQAAAIDATPEAKTGVETAKRKLQEVAAAGRAQEYAQQVGLGDAAAKSGDWQKALDAYTKAEAIEKSAEIAAKIATARKALADAVATAEKQRQYAKLMADGDAAVKAANWAKALDAYTAADAINDTTQAKAGIELAKGKLAAASSAAAAAAQSKGEFTKLMGDGDALAKAGDWAKALDAYNKAAVIDNNAEVKAAIANAKKKLADAAASSAAASAAAEKKLEFTKLMGDGNALAKAGDWAKALDAYNKAAVIDNNAEVKAAIANAKKKLMESAAASAAATAAERKKIEYAKLMGDANTAAQAGDWKTALDDYTKAAAIDNTAEAQAGVATAKKKLAEAAAAANAAAAAEANKKEFAKWDAAGDAAAKAGDWQKAIDAYTKAGTYEDTPDNRAAIANAKNKLAEAASAAAAAAEKKKQYTALMTDGDAAFKAGDWPKALEAYNKAAEIDNTAEVKADIAKTKKKITDAAAVGKKVDYASLLADGNAAAKAGDWQTALDLYLKSQELKDSPEVRTAIANAKKKLGQ